MTSSYVILTTEVWFDAVLDRLPSHVQEIVVERSQRGLHAFGQNLVEISGYNEGCATEEDMDFMDFENLLFQSKDDVYVKTFDSASEDFEDPIDRGFY